MLEVLDNLTEGPWSDPRLVLRSYERIGRRNAPRSVRASRAARERGAAMLATVQVERRELSAFPTEDPRQGPERLHDAVDVAARTTPSRPWTHHRRTALHRDGGRSEERRVGKECRSRW